MQELEQNDKRTDMLVNQLRQALEQSQQRETDLKRRVDELEREVSDLRDIDSPTHTKRLRISDVSEYPDPPQPLPAAV